MGSYQSTPSCDSTSPALTSCSFVSMSLTSSFFLSCSTLFWIVATRCVFLCLSPCLFPCLIPWYLLDSGNQPYSVVSSLNFMLHVPGAVLLQPMFSLVALLFSPSLHIPVSAYLYFAAAPSLISSCAAIHSHFTSLAYRCCRSCFVMEYLSAVFLLNVALFVVPSSGFLFGKVAILSPSPNVHVDVMNHVASSLDSHSQLFHSTWRDYSLLFLLVVFCLGTVLLCCGIAALCIYRGVLLRLRNRSVSTAHISASSTHRLTP